MARGSNSADSGTQGRKEPNHNMDANIISLRMERQCFLKKADREEYQKLYRDTQPGQNVYWNGFGEPPTALILTTKSITGSARADVSL